MEKIKKLKKKKALLGKQLPCRELPCSSNDKESACDAENPRLIPKSGRFLEKEIATHSSILAWRISRTEKPGELPSLGSQRVGYD